MCAIEKHCFFLYFLVLVLEFQYTLAFSVRKMVTWALLYASLRIFTWAVQSRNSVFEKIPPELQKDVWRWKHFLRFGMSCILNFSSTRRKETRSLLCSRLAWMRGWNQNCCLCVVTRLGLFYSGHYCLICGDFLKSLGVWSIYMPLRVR